MRMKVMFVTRGFPSETDIMSGNYEAVQAKALAAKGIQVAVVSVRLVSFLHLISTIRIKHRKVDGVDVYDCIGLKASTRFWKLPRINELLVNWSYRRVVNQCIKDNGMPDVVHAHLMINAFRTSFLKEEYHLPLVITEHWTEMNKPDISPKLRKMAFVYHQADSVICVSQALADSLQHSFQVNSLVINNMVSDQFFENKKVERHDGQFRFVACGAFRPNRNKGFDILIDAFAQADFPKHVRLDIIGDGQDKINIQDKIIEYGLSDQIHLLGVMPPEEVSKQLCCSDCFVLSSRLETFAIVVIEAMAKGLPIIATRSGGPETFLRPDHGILIDKENTEQLACAMKEMVEHHSQYDADSIRAFCYSHFSQDVIAEKIIDVYRQVTQHYD